MPKENPYIRARAAYAERLDRQYQSGEVLEWHEQRDQQFRTGPGGLAAPDFVVFVATGPAMVEFVWIEAPNRERPRAKAAYLAGQWKHVKHVAARLNADGMWSEREVRE